MLPLQPETFDELHCTSSFKIQAQFNLSEKFNLSHRSFREKAPLNTLSRYIVHNPKIVVFMLRLRWPAKQYWVGEMRHKLSARIWDCGEGDCLKWKFFSTKSTSSIDLSTNWHKLRPQLASWASCRTIIKWDFSIWYEQLLVHGNDWP